MRMTSGIEKGSKRNDMKMLDGVIISVYEFTPLGGASELRQKLSARRLTGNPSRAADGWRAVP